MGKSRVPNPKNAPRANRQPKTARNPKGSGRPTDYSPELASRICIGLIEGKSLRNICKGPEFPDRTTVLYWLERYPDFASKYARARELQADFLDEEIMERAEKATVADWQLARLQITTMQWRASKLAPKKYGDRVLHENTNATALGDDADTRKRQITNRIAGLLEAPIHEQANLETAEGS